MFSKKINQTSGFLNKAGNSSKTSFKKSSKDEATEIKVSILNYPSIFRDDIHVVKALRDSGISDSDFTTWNERTLLHALLSHDLMTSEILDVILSSFGKLEDPQVLQNYLSFKDTKGRTAFHAAVKTGNPIFIGKMAHFGSDIDIKDNNGQTPLHWAVLYGSYDLVRYILDLGSNAKLEVDCKNSTLLHVASKRGNLEIFETVLDFGIDVNSKGPKGWTALHYAARNGNLGIIKQLIEAGSDLDAIGTYDSRVPEQIAFNHRNNLAWKMLLKARQIPEIA